VSGHSDIALAPASGGGLGLGFDHAADAAFVGLGAGDDPASPETTFVRVGDGQEIARPPQSQWDFLGAEPGGTIFFLPQSTDPDAPYLGVSAEALSPSVWQSVDYRIDGVDGPDGGVFSVWQVGVSGVPVVLASSVDGLPDSFAVPPGSHSHYNWGFSERGVYRITITAVASPIAGDPAEAAATFWFAVGDDATIPPSCPADADGDGVVALGDLLTVLGAFGGTASGPGGGDLTGDGTVDLDDLLIVLARFGEDCE
jgi:surface-anchored protein